MLKLRDLALQPDIVVGPLAVSPSRRRISGPAGEAAVEPLIMQVFLLLLQSKGRVVTRDELFDQCWGGVIVGDDSLNRAVGKVRKIGSETAPGLFEIETIPRTGYRMTGEILEHLEQSSSPTAEPGISRRSLVAGGIAVAAVAGGAAVWAAWPRGDSQFDALMDKGQEALRLDAPASAYFKQAVARKPGSAAAHGLLAYSIATESEEAPGGASGSGPLLAERAARAALRIDPNEPNALLTMTLLQSEMLDWLSRERRYEHILELDPENLLVMRSYGQLLHAVGRCRESLAIIERAIAIEPLVPDNQVRKALRLWVIGRTADADSVIKRAMELWPSHRLVRLGQLMILAFTGRARAALALVDDEATQPILLTPAAATLWRISLRALDAPTSVNIEAARKAIIDGASSVSAIAAWAILLLSQLGELDAAFQVANGFLLGRGSIVVKLRPDTKGPSVHGPGWRNTFGLFTPPTRAMRLDPRFNSLAAGLGLTEYWHQRGIGPDAFLFKR